MKFLVTGGTGLIGKSIVQLLIEKNHHINVLSRKRGEDTKQVRYYQWSPKNQTIDFTCIDDVDVIINLAKDNIKLESKVNKLQIEQDYLIGMFKIINGIDEKKAS